MTNINFYVSQQNGFENRLNIVYKLIGHALKRNLFIHIHTDNENMNKHVDAWLWTTNKVSFIPHQIINTSSADSSNNHSSNPIASISDGTVKIITISHEYEPLSHCDYLINLSSQRPRFFSRFIKLAEVLDNSDDILSAGRKRYAFYRDRGYNLEYHKL